MRSAGCVFADDEARVLRRWAGDDEQLARWVRRRETGEPLEHIVGHVEFGGLDLSVGPGVFVPRNRSMLLAEIATGLVAELDGPLVEACCGVAPIAAVVADRLPRTSIVLADSDRRALDHARRNVPGALLCPGDLLSAVRPPVRGSASVVAAVPPYVPTGEAALLPAEAVDHEQPSALFGGDDGLDVVRRLLTDAVDVIRPGGAVALESHTGQAPAAVEVAEARGFRARVVDGEDGQTAVLVAHREIRA